MEILNMTFAGIPIGILIFIVAVEFRAKYDCGIFACEIPLLTGGGESG